MAVSHSAPAGGAADKPDSAPRATQTSLKPAETGIESRPYPEIPIADGFVFPVGPPDARGYYDAQPFGRNNHLGEDWNGTKGGNSDLGDPIYSIGKGVISYAGDGGPGWGNVVRICHNIGTTGTPFYVESLYGHLKTIGVSEGTLVAGGQQIGTMGNVDGMYYAHLHLELRARIGMPIGAGYSVDPDGFVDPTHFIKTHMETNAEKKQ